MEINEIQGQKGLYDIKKIKTYDFKICGDVVIIQDGKTIHARKIESEDKK